MDARARNKALFRAKVKETAQKREKQRIDSPLVRYNENGQPVCRVCNVALKSESVWPAHLASRKHHDAIENVKAAAAGVCHGNDTNVQPTTGLHKTRTSSSLPADFFGNQETKRQRNDMGVRHITQSLEKPMEPDVGDNMKEVYPAGRALDVPRSVDNTDDLSNDQLVETNDKSENESNSILVQNSKKLGGSKTKQAKEVLPEGFFDSKGRSENQISVETAQSQMKQVKGVLPDGFFESKERSVTDYTNQLSVSSKRLGATEAKQTKGSLPEGFFDNRDADLRARGVEPVKVDMDDAYKEFEKEIEENLQVVDDRLEEEEIDAAEVREEFESLEQQAYREQMELVKIKVLEAKAACNVRMQQNTATKGQESSDESLSEGDEDEESFAVDWRAQHL